MNGLVIAGGQSSRMGEDKALIDYHGIPQSQYVYEMLNTHCDRVYISSKEDRYDIPVILDDKKYVNSGPIAGLLSAFDFQKTDWIIIAVDYPLISNEDILRLVKSEHDLASALYNSETRFYEPFLGLYRKPFGEILTSNFQQGNTSMQKILKRIDAEKIIPVQIQNIQSVDTPEQMRDIQAQLK